ITKVPCNKAPFRFRPKKFPCSRSSLLSHGISNSNESHSKHGWANDPPCHSGVGGHKLRAEYRPQFAAPPTAFGGVRGGGTGLAHQGQYQSKFSLL
ncbi:MAG: hypothetical protein ACK55Z_30540, partial [bacterium]